MASEDIGWSQVIVGVAVFLGAVILIAYAVTRVGPLAIGATPTWTPGPTCEATYPGDPYGNDKLNSCIALNNQGGAPYQ